MVRNHIIESDVRVEVHPPVNGIRPNSHMSHWWVVGMNGSLGGAMSRGGSYPVIRMMDKPECVRVYRNG